MYACRRLKALITTVPRDGSIRSFINAALSASAALNIDDVGIVHVVVWQITVTRLRTRVGGVDAIRRVTIAPAVESSVLNRMGRSSARHRSEGADTVILIPLIVRICAIGEVST